MFKSCQATKLGVYLLPDETTKLGPLVATLTGELGPHGNEVWSCCVHCEDAEPKNHDTPHVESCDECADDAQEAVDPGPTVLRDGGLQTEEQPKSTLQVLRETLALLEQHASERGTQTKSGRWNDCGWSFATAIRDLKTAIWCEESYAEWKNEVGG